MTVTFNAANASVSAAPQDIIQSALYEAGILGAGDPLQAEDLQWGLEKLQRIIDSWNARQELIFSVSFEVFSLIANHAPHTIGPSGDFSIPLRPVRIASASFLLNQASSNPVDTPIKIRDKSWWAGNPLKSLTSSIVTDLYYDPATPLGNANFYPICDISNEVRLEIWNSLAQAIDPTTQLGLAQGYWEALVTTLGINLCPSYKVAVSADLREQNRMAMSAILGNNDEPPGIDTSGNGLPGSARNGRPDFNFLTGLRE